jgi:glycerate kinase
MPARLLIAPSAFSDALDGEAVAAALGRGVVRAGLEPPELCPVADGGPGTLAVLAAALGGGRSAVETPGLAFVGDGATAIVEAPTGRAVGERVAAAAAAGARTVLVACGAARDADGALAAIRAHGGVRGARLVALCPVRPAARAPDGLARALHEALGARLEPGAPYVLDALGFDARMREARAVIVGDGRLDEATLFGTAAGEIAVRARQAGVPCHAVCAASALAPFDQRILDLQRVVEAATPEDLEAAGAFLATHL